MVEPGLSERLRRHSRSSGMMVGVSMAIAMVLCIAAFIWFYVQIGPLLSDFIPQGSDEEDIASDSIGLIGVTPEATPTPMGTPSGSQTGSGASGDKPASGISGEPTPTGNSILNPEVEETPEEDVWEPTHQIREGPNVNFRSGPNTISQTQGALAPGTPLRFIGDEEPAAGVIWMHFEIQDGTDGWIRDIDVIEYDDGDVGGSE